MVETVFWVVEELVSQPVQPMLVGLTVVVVAAIMAPLVVLAGLA
jgi:hypothetical protein